MRPEPGSFGNGGFPAVPNHDREDLIRTLQRDQEDYWMRKMLKAITVAMVLGLAASFIQQL